MTDKRFDYVMNEFDEIEYISDNIDCEDRDFADFLDYVNEMAKENESLKKKNKKLINEYNELLYEMGLSEDGDNLEELE